MQQENKSSLLHERYRSAKTPEKKQSKGPVKFTTTLRQGKCAQFGAGCKWRSLVKTSFELQSYPLFQINRRPKSLRSATFGQVY
jgi:hypothetical protein